MTEAAGSSEPLPSSGGPIQPDEIQCSSCSRWQSPDQFQAKGCRSLTKTCLRCREKKRPNQEGQPSPKRTRTARSPPRGNESLDTPNTAAAGQEQAQIHHSRETKGKGKAPASEFVLDADETDPEDYNIRSAERTGLLVQLNDQLGNVPVSPTLWACCQLCDKRKLSALVKSDEDLFIGYDNALDVVPLLWSQRFRDSRESERSTRKLNSDGHPWVQRSGTARDLCNQRDGGKCVLTKASRPVFAHIFLYCMLNTPPPHKERKHSDMIPKFWRLLNIFWGKDRVNTWRRKIFPNAEKPDTGVDEPFNLISLTSDAHDMWNRGEFALKPLELSSDNTELTVQFFWQIPNKYELGSSIDLLKEPASSKGLNRGADRWLSYEEDDGSLHKIRSGEVFTFRTTDPKTLPLPSMELLEMQWYLQRLVAMSGAAGWPSLDCDDDDDLIPCLNPSYADGNVNTTFQGVYEWIPSPLPPLDSEPDVATCTTRVECV